MSAPARILLRRAAPSASSLLRQSLKRPLNSLNPGPVPVPPNRPSCLAEQRRTLARSSGPANETPEDKARSFVIGVGHDPEVARGVVGALADAGLSGDALLATVRSMAGRWEVGEDEGLEDLVASVQKAQAITEGRKMVEFWCVPPNAWASGEGEEGQERPQSEEDRETMMARAFVVRALEGTSLTDAAKFGEGEGASTLGEYIECACSGIMACSTCHVVIDPEWFDRVGEPEEAEQDMLDLAYSPRDTSRLGCKIVLSKDVDGLVVRLPKNANNLMDYVPFQ